LMRRYLRKTMLKLIPILFLCASCAATSKNIKGPDGTEHKLISGTNIELCYTKATEICNGTYKIINTSSYRVETATVFDLLVKCDK
jgi:hypothetical protein